MKYKRYEIQNCLKAKHRLTSPMQGYMMTEFEHGFRKNKVSGGNCKMQMSENRIPTSNRRLFA
jgi:hypothetical protein